MQPLVVTNHVSGKAQWRRQRQGQRAQGVYWQCGTSSGGGGNTHCQWAKLWKRQRTHITGDALPPLALKQLTCYRMQPTHATASSIKRRLKEATVRHVQQRLLHLAAGS
jgi:hypothetical protein